MTIRLHHFFVLTSPGAPQADSLSGLGLLEGPRNDHPGQGTANRRFFFSNVALELLYVRDENEAATGSGSRLRIADRVTGRAASPFGLVFESNAETAEPPFAGWRYYPDYFPAGQCFHVGKNSDRLEEPLCIWLPPTLALPATRMQPSNPLMTLTELRLSVPVVRPSPTLAAVGDCGLISLSFGEPHRLELVFDEGRRGLRKDLTPDLPMVICW